MHTTLRSFAGLKCGRVGFFSVTMGSVNHYTAGTLNTVGLGGALQQLNETHKAFMLREYSTRKQ